MTPTDQDSGAAKPPRPKRTRAAKPRKGQAPETVKASVRLSVESWKRLSHFAIETRRDRNRVLEELIRDHLGRYVVSDRGERAAGPAPRADAA